MWALVAFSFVVVVKAQGHGMDVYNINHAANFLASLINIWLIICCSKEAKFYQVKQVLMAINKLKEEGNEK